MKVMLTFGETIRKAREERNLVMRMVAEQLHIDPSLLSRIERGVKRPTRRQVILLAAILDKEERDLLIEYFSDRVVRLVVDERMALAILRTAEEKIKVIREEERKERRAAKDRNGEVADHDRDMESDHDD